MSQAAALYQLQQIDLGILRSQKRLQAIAEALANDEAVSKAQKQADSAQQALNKRQAKVRDLELEIASNRDKSKATEDRLYSGSVTNPKELQDMQHEIEALKRRLTELEDQLLEAMVASEEAQAAFDNADSALKDALVNAASNNQDLFAEQTELQAKVTDLQNQREDAVGRIPAEDLQLYNTLRVKKRNQPVSAINGRSCSLCGVEQTGIIVQEVRRGQSIVYCANCGRILVEN